MPADITKFSGNRALQRYKNTPLTPKRMRNKPLYFNWLSDYNFFYKSVNKRILGFLAAGFSKSHHVYYFDRFFLVWLEGSDLI